MGDEYVSIAFYVEASPAEPVDLEIEISEPWQGAEPFYRLVEEAFVLKSREEKKFTAQYMKITLSVSGIYGVIAKGPVTYLAPKHVPVVVKEGKDPWPRPPPPPPPSLIDPPKARIKDGLPDDFLLSLDKAEPGHGVTVSSRTWSNRPPVPLAPSTKEAS